MIHRSPHTDNARVAPAVIISIAFIFLELFVPFLVLSQSAPADTTTKEQAAMKKCAQLQPPQGVKGSVQEKDGKPYKEFKCDPTQPPNTQNPCVTYDDPSGQVHDTCATGNNICTQVPYTDELGQQHNFCKEWLNPIGSQNQKTPNLNDILDQSKTLKGETDAATPQIMQPLDEDRFKCLFDSSACKASVPTPESQGAPSATAALEKISTEKAQDAARQALTDDRASSLAREAFLSAEEARMRPLGSTERDVLEETSRKANTDLQSYVRESTFGALKADSTYWSVEQMQGGAISKAQTGDENIFIDNNSGRAFMSSEIGTPKGLEGISVVSPSGERTPLSNTDSNWLGAFKQSIDTSEKYAAFERQVFNDNGKISGSIDPQVYKDFRGYGAELYSDKTKQDIFSSLTLGKGGIASPESGGWTSTGVLPMETRAAIIDRVITQELPLYPDAVWNNAREFTFTPALGGRTGGDVMQNFGTQVGVYTSAYPDPTSLNYATERAFNHEFYHFIDPFANPDGEKTWGETKFGEDYFKYYSGQGVSASNKFGAQPFFANPYGSTNGAEDRATTAELLMYNPSFAESRAATDPFFARGLSMIKDSYERLSGGVMNNDYWSQLAARRNR